MRSSARVNYFAPRLPSLWVRLYREALQECISLSPPNDNLMSALGEAKYFWHPAFSAPSDRPLLEARSQRHVPDHERSLRFRINVHKERIRAGISGDY
jgi:hypothetical protein